MEVTANYSNIEERCRTGRNKTKIVSTNGFQKHYTASCLAKLQFFESFENHSCLVNFRKLHNEREWRRRLSKKLHSQTYKVFLSPCHHL